MTALSQQLCGSNLKIHVLASCNGKNTVIYRIHTYSKIGPQYLPRKGHSSLRMYGLHMSSVQCTMQQHIPYILHKVQHLDKFTLTWVQTQTPKHWWQHMHYIALSRVTTLSGLYLKDLNEEKMCISRNVANYIADARKMLNWYSPMCPCILTEQNN